MGVQLNPPQKIFRTNFITATTKLPQRRNFSPQAELIDVTFLKVLSDETES
ncbi:MAG: hypothetical protein IKE46_08705 [Selenomonadaceae bacterium]|nr:hypothetical protein [Selenomonadaceae bacterium]MBR3747087.1 hypothetical protein [Selenomonadaceae bacterium]